MALPWLIGAAALAAVNAVAAALSDDIINSSINSNNEAEERRKAGRERKERQRKEKMEALEASYNERLELDSKRMTSLLNTMAEIDNVQESMVVIEAVPQLEMNPDGSYKDVLTRHIINNKSALDNFHSNVVFFEQLYSGYVEPKAEVTQISEAIDNLERQTKKIDSLIKQLG